tara:strand:- start:365 stop:604 length:240 start_codon:yes stop_codon:yes gene_type:complete
MHETKIVYTIESRQSNTDDGWERVKLSHFVGDGSLLESTSDEQEARYKINSLRETAKTYHWTTEYRIIKATTTFEVLDE